MEAVGLSVGTRGSPIKGTRDAATPCLDQSPANDC